MGWNETPAAERVHIAFFGRRNAGKSSLINAVTGQSLSVVSRQKGTTTDPVAKSMELLPIGPVVMIDTPGFDDEGELGKLRIKKTKEVLSRTDCAVLVIDATAGGGACETELLAMFKEREIPYLVVWNKADERAFIEEDSAFSYGAPIYVSAKTGAGVNELKERIGALLKDKKESRRIIGDFIMPGDVAVLVVPIDAAAPKGRLILPQQQTIRDILEAEGIPVVVKDTHFAEALAALSKKPRLVITDSQVFPAISAQVPEEIPLTSFSILMARYKGFLRTAVEGVRVLDTLKSGDKVLISEGCTHHRQCGDIGTVKLPHLIRAYTKAEPAFVFSSGKDFPEELCTYRLVIHCGGCMLTQRELDSRQKVAEGEKIPFTNYGTAIAYMNGILKRSIALFPEVAGLLP